MLPIGRHHRPPVCGILRRVSVGTQLGYPNAGLEAVSEIVQGRPLHWAGLRRLHLNGLRLMTFQTHRVSPAFRHCSGLSPVHNVSHPCSDVY